MTSSDNNMPGEVERECVGYQLMMNNTRWTVVLYSEEEAIAAVSDPKNLITASRPVFALTQQESRNAE